MKPKIIVCNVDEKSLSDGNKYTESVKKNIKMKKLLLFVQILKTK